MNTVVRKADDATPRLRPLAIAHMAWRELWHDRGLSAVAIAVVAMLLTLLWTLWAQERNIVDAALRRLDNDPRMRLIVASVDKAPGIDDILMRRIQRWDDVRLALPLLRTPALLNKGPAAAGASASAGVEVTLQATAPGDPLLNGATMPEADAVLLDARTAGTLGLAPGGELQVSVQRRLGEQVVTGRRTLKLGAVIPSGPTAERVGLVSVAVMEALQDWQDGRSVKAMGDDSDSPPPKMRTRSQVRLYVASIRDVAPVVARLERDGAKASAHTREVEATLAVQTEFQAALIWLAAGMFAAALLAQAVIQALLMRRRQLDHALLLLTGHGGAWLVCLALLQGLVFAAAGVLIACLLCMSSPPLPGELMAGAAAAVLAAAMPALFAGLRAARQTASLQDFGV